MYIVDELCSEPDILVQEDSDNTIIPDGFPREGNEETLIMMQPLYKRFACIEKILTAIAINALTLNVRPSNDKHGYNSNFVVMPAGFGKTTALEGIFNGNPENTYLVDPKHFESEMYDKPGQLFFGKTWLNSDGIATFASSSTKQLNQLVDFYTMTLSDGRYARSGRSIEADYNTMIAIATEMFIKLESVFKGRTLFERIFPIFFYPTLEEEAMIEDKKDDLKNIDVLDPLILRYSENLDDYENKPKFYIDKSLKTARSTIKEKLTKYSGISVNRVDTYLDNFLASNAFLNNRIKLVNGLERIYPDENDIKLFEWLLDIHSRFEHGSMDEIVYHAMADTNSPVTSRMLFEMDEFQKIMFTNMFEEMTFENMIKLSLTRLKDIGLIIKIENRGDLLYSLNSNPVVRF